MVWLLPILWALMGLQRGGRALVQEISNSTAGCLALRAAAVLHGDDVAAGVCVLGWTWQLGQALSTSASLWRTGEFFCSNNSATAMSFSQK